MDAPHTQLVGQLDLLPVDRISLRINEMRELELELDGRVYRNVQPVRSFPLSNRESFIALWDAKGLEEIGIIEEIEACSLEVAELLREWLRNTYLVPQINRIESISVRGLVPVWRVETDRGPRTFEVPSRRDVTPLGTRVLVRDADGNRYEIKDWTQLDARSRRFIEQEI